MRKNSWEMIIGFPLGYDWALTVWMMYSLIPTEHAPQTKVYEGRVVKRRHSFHGYLG